MRSGGDSISIWFFIGISLLVNGLLITGAGIYELLNPPQHPEIALFHVHANVWWGTILFVAGVIYSFYFAPSRKRA
jgi:hypothetical protein